MTAYNEVTRPRHYDWATFDGVSALEAFADTSYAFGCGMKYILRYPMKHQYQDVEKAKYLFDYMVKEASEDGEVPLHSIHGSTIFEWWVQQLVQRADLLTAMQRQIFSLLYATLECESDGGLVSSRTVRIIRDLLAYYLDQPLDVIPASDARSATYKNIFTLPLITPWPDCEPHVLVRDGVLSPESVDPSVEQWVVSHPIYQMDPESPSVPAVDERGAVHAASASLGGQL